MDLTDREAVFLAVLRAALRDRKADPALLAGETDWDGLLNLALEHKLLPMIVEAVPGEMLSGVPAAKQAALRQVVNQTVHTRSFMTLYQKMRRAGFHPLVVKGVLCRGLYPQGDLRPSGDEDVLVPDGEFEDCCAFLRDYGMIPTGEDDPGAFEIGWQKPGTNLYIELHRRLFSPDSRVYGDLEAFFEGAADRAAVYPGEYGVAVYSLSAHDHLLYLLLHAYKHFLHSGFGIRQVCDICLWAGKYHDRIDWDLLERQCEGCGTRKFAAAVFGIGVHFLEIPLELPGGWRTDRDFCVPMLRDILCGGIYGAADGERRHAATVTLNAVAADRAGGRRSVWQSVFLPLAAMEKKYPWLKKWPILLPAAWLLRIWGYLRKGGSAAASITIGEERVKLLRTYDIIR